MSGPSAGLLQFRALAEAARTSLLSPLADRRAFHAALAGGRALPAGVTVTEDALAGTRALRVEVAGHADGPPLLHLHGGAFVLGSPDAALGLVVELCRRLGAPVWSLDYPLAPEHPFPAARDSVVAALTELTERAGDRPVLLVGDSAGGGLAVSAMLRLAAAGAHLPAAAALFSPWLDLALQHRSPHEDDPVLDRGVLRADAARYLAGRDPRDPSASPAHAPVEQLAGLPAVHLSVGATDLLRPDSERFAAALAAAGVPHSLVVVDGAPHAFHSFPELVPEAARTLDAAGEALRTAAAAVRP